MNSQNRTSRKHPSEMLSLNLDDLNVEELEVRRELASGLLNQALLPCVNNSCPSLRSCGHNTCI